MLWVKVYDLFTQIWSFKNYLWVLFVTADDVIDV